MKLDLSNVNYSNFNIKLNVKVPSILDSKLSYLSGVHMGDGSMGNYKKYYYSIEYSGHLTDEYDFYANYFNKLFKDLFNKELRVYRKFKDNGSYLCLCTQLKGIFTFLSTALNLPIGPKKYAPIPEIIINSPYLKDFIRGYADADFCLTFKKRNSDIHYYPSISLKSSSKIMVLQLSDSLKQLGFSVYNLLDFPSPRYGITHVANFIDINGVTIRKLDEINRI